MPFIRPISDLRNKFNKIASICHNEQEPVFLTKNGQGDLVVMSLSLYQKQQNLLDLYQKLGEAEAESRSDAPTITHQDFMKQLRERFNEQ
ncbi:MAG: type II toxin-antitoxin system Phd/YefM family antitoxin [Bacillota bacterium]|nr:type II toxin-antitoxin system Phd/YefM family antitoxin [Bacillota bacterium]MDD3298438.1 type II toxin-antitoxin system Phd/YefM family antitoxin [Bacillota bacterium]MDD3851644.1 type II toxin-antitoxin system Phd/YefM family antitoxin [Bacillota bacterium]